MATVALLVAFASPMAEAATNGVPVAGKSLTLRAASGGAELGFKSDLDAAVRAPFPDPRQGASLKVFSSNLPGHCRADVELPAAGWSAIGKAGTEYGWRYRDAEGRKIVVRGKGGAGRIRIKAAGPGFPCGLEAESQEVPISVVLQIGGTRYCASFGGAVKKNIRGLFKAEDATRPPACPDDDFTVATLNVLHGLPCPPETTFCRLTDRIDLLGQWIVGRGCPAVLSLQEVFENANLSMPNLIRERLANVCPVPYEVVHIRTNGVDDALLLTRHRPLIAEVRRLYGPLRNALFARLDHPLGPLDVFATHLASSSDAGPAPCGRFGPCPPECLAAAAPTVRDCQAVQLAALVEERHDVDPPAFIVGDFNAEPGSFAYDQLVDRGWADTTLAAGNPECDPASGTGCTSGRADDGLGDLESPALNVDSRIDFIFLVPQAPASSCSGDLDSPDDADGDGVATRLFADEPNPFSPACGPLPAPLCWVSDHSGAQADVNCD